MNNHKLAIENKDNDNDGKQIQQCPLRGVHISKKQRKIMDKHSQLLEEIHYLNTVC